MTTPNAESKDDELEALHNHFRLIGLQTHALLAVSGVPQYMIALSALHCLVKAIREVAREDMVAGKQLADDIARSYVEVMGSMGFADNIGGGNEVN